jgi:hypothetical protein
MIVDWFFLTVMGNIYRSGLLLIMLTEQHKNIERVMTKRRLLFIAKDLNTILVMSY